MELLAVIKALEALKIEGSHVEIFTDSRYVCEAVEEGWVFSWERKQFKKKKNRDLWLRFLEVYRKHKVKFHWVKGHSNVKENERCDKLATLASKTKHPLIDENSENEQKEANNTLF
jgi:ribonuclease HI